MRWLIEAVVVLLVAGVLAYIIQSAPFIEAPYKAAAKWVVLVIVLIWLVSVLLRVTGVHIPG